MQVQGTTFSSTLCTSICGKRVTTVANSLPCGPSASEHAAVGSNFPKMLTTSSCGQRETTVGSFRIGTPTLSSKNSQLGQSFINTDNLHMHTPIHSNHGNGTTEHQKMENQQTPTLLSLCFHRGWVCHKIILDIPSNSIFPISAKPFFIPVCKYELCSSHTQKGYKNCC